jgi:uncharacterized OsmC-like protein
MGDRPEPFTAEIVVTPDSEYKTATLRNKHTVHVDEPPWIPHGAGNDDHPAPVDHLLLSLTSCQTAVLMQCLEKNEVEAFRIECNGEIDGYERAEDLPDVMPENTATRISHITVTMDLFTTPEFEEVANRCLMAYDDGCIVGQSLEGGIDYTSMTRLTVTDELSA